MLRMILSFFVLPIVVVIVVVVVVVVVLIIVVRGVWFLITKNGTQKETAPKKKGAGFFYFFAFYSGSFIFFFLLKGETFLRSWILNMNQKRKRKNREKRKERNNQPKREVVGTESNHNSLIDVTSNTSRGQSKGRCSFSLFIPDKTCQLGQKGNYQFGLGGGASWALLTLQVSFPHLISSSQQCKQVKIKRCLTALNIINVDSLFIRLS